MGSLESRNFYDITPLICPELAVFPGDQPFSRKEVLSFGAGDNLCLSQVTTTVHLGAHTDAPNHYHPDGGGIESRSLDYYLGECQVVEVTTEKGGRIKPVDLKDEIKSPRVLLKTFSFPDPHQWNNDFTACSPELIEFLAEKKVKLIGIDTPSVDLSEDKELISHNTIYKQDLAILEGIVLTDVPQGVYELVALPLKIQNADASPVRAILFEVSR